MTAAQGLLPSAALSRPKLVYSALGFLLCPCPASQPQGKSPEPRPAAGCWGAGLPVCGLACAPQARMGDDHDHGHDVHFESADAGASLTYPQQAGTVRKNGFLVIKGRPCKVRIGAELVPINAAQSCCVRAHLGSVHVAA